LVAPRSALLNDTHSSTSRLRTIGRQAVGQLSSLRRHEALSGLHLTYQKYRGVARRVAPYLILAALPGGSILVLLRLLHQRRKSQPDRSGKRRSVSRAGR